MKKLLNSMDKVNPIYIPRNHKVEEALHEAVFKNNMRPFNKLTHYAKPIYEEIDGFESFAEARS